MKTEGGMSVEQAEMHLEQLKADGRYVTEVY